MRADRVQSVRREFLKVQARVEKADTHRGAFAKHWSGVMVNVHLQLLGAVVAPRDDHVPPTPFSLAEQRALTSPMLIRQVQSRVCSLLMKHLLVLANLLKAVKMFLDERIWSIC